MAASRGATFHGPVRGIEAGSVLMRADLSLFPSSRSRKTMLADVDARSAAR
jgi:hypothetical protein